MEQLHIVQRWRSIFHELWAISASVDIMELLGILGSYQLCAAVLKTPMPFCRVRKHLVYICLYTLYGLDKIALVYTVQFRFA